MLRRGVPGSDSEESDHAQDQSEQQPRDEFSLQHAPPVGQPDFAECEGADDQTWPPASPSFRHWR